MRRRWRSCAHFCMYEGWPSRLDCLKERLHPEYRQHPFEVVRQHMQTHLGAHMLERFHLEVGRAHPGFQCAERMLDGFPSRAHPLRFLIEAGFGSLKYRLMFPSCYSPVGTGRTLRLDGAGRAVGGPVFVERQAFLLCLEPPDEALPGWAFILIIIRMVHEVAFTQ